MLVKTIVFAISVTLGATVGLAQGGTKAVTLSKTRPCMILNGTVQPKKFDTYRFRAKKGQTIVADPFFYGKETNRPKNDEEGSSGFVIVLPNGKRFENPQDVQFDADQTGTYKVLVKPTYRRTTGRYRLKISVTDSLPTGIDDPNKAPTCP